MSGAARGRTAPRVTIATVPLAELRGYALAALAASWVGYFLFTGMPQLTLHVFPATLTSHVLIGCLALAYAASLAYQRRLPGGTLLDAGVLAVIAAYVVATYASINWRMSMETTLQLGGAIIAFYALADMPWLSAAHLRRMATALALALALYTLWVVGNDYADYVSFARRVEGLTPGNIFPPTVPRAHSVSDHPNVLAMILALLMPIALLSAWRGDPVWERWAGRAALACGAMALFLTLSRSGWLGASAGLILAAVGIALTLRAYAREEAGFAPSWDNALPRDISPTAVATVIGALALAAGGTLAFLSSSETRPGWLFRSSLSPREDAWETGLDMFRDHAAFGAGPNTFGLLYGQYSGRFPEHAQHAHNGFLQAAIDLGVVGVLALAVLAGIIVFMLLRSWRLGALEHRLLAVACAAGLTAFSIHNMLDAGNIWKAPPYALALAGAIIVRLDRERPQDAASARPWGDALRGVRLATGAGMLALLVVPFAAWYRIDAAHHDYWRGLDAVNQGDFGGIGRLQQAVDADSSMMVYQLALGRAQADLYVAQRREGGEGDRFLIENAVIHLERAAELDSRSDITRANLARAYELAGRDDDAAREAAVSRFAARHVPPLLIAGEVYEAIGREDDALSTYSQAISTDAGLADSAFWQLTPWRRDHFAEIIESSVLGQSPCTFGSFLVEAHRSDASSPLARLPDLERGCKIVVFSNPNDLTVRVALGRIMMEQGKLDEAFVHLGFAANRQPDFGPARTELGRWFAARGDVDEARHQWVLGGQLDQPESLLLLGESYEDSGEPVPDGVVQRLKDQLGEGGSNVRNDLLSVLYFRLRYARMSPVSAFISGDWQRAVPRLFERMEQALARWGGR